MSSSIPADGVAKKKRRLSSGLSSLKFMQKKSEAKLRKQLEATEKKKLNAKHWTVPGAADAGDSDSDDAAAGGKDDVADKSDDSETEAQPPRIVRDAVAPQTHFRAGRRSFGNFNARLEETVAAAVAVRDGTVADAGPVDETIGVKAMVQRTQKYIGLPGAGRPRAKGAPKGGGAGGGGGDGACYDFQKGKCTRGDKCKFAHTGGTKRSATVGGISNGGGGKRQRVMEASSTTSSSPPPAKKKQFKKPPGAH
jgi:hypothetical protein